MGDFFRDIFYEWQPLFGAVIFVILFICLIKIIRRVFFLALLVGVVLFFVFPSFRQVLLFLGSFLKNLF